jgi:hypothetical protein
MSVIQPTERVNRFVLPSASRPLLSPDSWPFYNHRQRFSSSNTECGETSTGIADFHGMEQGREDTRAGGADRMTQRDCPTVDVDSLVVEA